MAFLAFVCCNLCSFRPKLSINQTNSEHSLSLILWTLNFHRLANVILMHFSHWKPSKIHEAFETKWHIIRLINQLIYRKCKNFRSFRAWSSDSYLRNLPPWSQLVFFLPPLFLSRSGSAEYIKFSKQKRRKKSARHIFKRFCSFCWCHLMFPPRTHNEHQIYHSRCW